MTEKTSTSMIEASGLTKYFGSFVAIDDVTFSIPRGQIVAFLGPNGAGKSTTMKILTGFLSASSGTAAIAGLNVETDRQEASRRLGYLPEDGPLYEDMTPIDLLRFFGEARCLESNHLKKRLDVVIEQCALQQVLEKPIGKLSRGYRQRVCLAQALLHDPEVLIMDEPTAGLDPNQIRDFRANIKRLGQSKTILISTHILQEVEAVADRVILIHDGRIRYDGPPADLGKGSMMENKFYEMTNWGKPIAETSSDSATGGVA